MATERKSPDALLDQTNLSGAVTAVQDDPDAPDASWLTAISNNAASICRTSFPTPTGSPTVGAGLQEFKIWVRKMGGTGTPQVRIELYENNVLLATLLADTNVTSTSGVLHSGTWDASLLGTADGSLVECRIYGTQSGGGPSARAAIEVGAVEWNVTYSVGVVVTPTPVSAIGGIVAPTVILGSIAITPSPALAIQAAIDPTVIYGSIIITPAAGYTIAGKVDPVVILGSLTIIPDFISAIAGISNPTVVIGGGGETVTPTPAFAIAGIVAPTVILGSLVIIPAPVSGIAGVVAPIVIHCSIVIIPSTIDAIGRRSNPTVVIQTLYIYITPDGAGAVGVTKNFTYQEAGKIHRRFAKL